MKIDGRCHCGLLAYEAEVEPDQVYVCHCADCQAISGTGFRWAVPVPEAKFTLLSGTPKTYIKRADSGATSHQLFCPECASPLYSTTIGAEPKTLLLRLGTARQRAQLAPRSEYWCGSAQEWLTVEGPTDRFETQ